MSFRTYFAHHPSYTIADSLGFVALINDFADMYAEMLDSRRNATLLLKLSMRTPNIFTFIRSTPSRSAICFLVAKVYVCVVFNGYVCLCLARFNGRVNCESLERILLSKNYYLYIYILTKCAVLSDVGSRTRR